MIAATSLALLLGCGHGAGPPTDAADRSRLAGQALYIDDESHPAQQAALLRQAGDEAGATRLTERIARRPIARWFAGQQTNPFPEAHAVSTAAADKRQVPVLVVYDLPGRDCGLYSSGGAPDDAAYLAYVGAFAAGLGDRTAIVVLEPDAVAHTVSGCSQASADHIHLLLRQATAILTRQSGAHVFLDAGNATWISDLTALAAALRSSGVASAAGFALNVANFSNTEDSARYGMRLSGLVNRAHFVIDTSRNGAGPPPPTAGTDPAHAWCNPPGRRLGTPPTTDPGRPRVDALLWVKTPGDSDGTCARGAPAAGQWWPQSAQDLLQ